MKKTSILEENKKSIILLDTVVPAQNNQSKVSIVGTGFIISEDGKFVTCAHVYNQIPGNERQYLGAKVPIETDNKGITAYKRYKVEFLDVDTENDMALMKIKPEDKDVFEPIKKFGDSESAKEGDDVVFAGYPLALELVVLGFGITLSLNHCIISAVKRRQVDGSLHFFMVDTHINNGSSGSPVFLIETGEIIGMAAGKISAKIPSPNGGQFDIPANMGICKPAKYIINLIEKDKSLSKQRR